MLEIQENVDIKNYSSLHIGGQFKYFCVISSIDELASVCALAQTDAKYKNISIFVLGGGSNMVFSDGILNVLALKIEIKGFEILNDKDLYTDIKIGGGEIWDKIVEKTVGMNLSGLESLSAIPGTVGASPVQNIGAYGAEVKDTIQEVEAFDIKKGIIIKISNEDCKFGYRDSIFKHELRGKYVITAVTYRLRKTSTSNFLFQALSYPGIKRYFIENNINNPTLRQIRETVIDIRNSKLPNPKELPNAGSFFKNPIVLNSVANNIKKQFQNTKFYQSDNDHTKIPAGWLIENAGLKGVSFGNVSIYEKNALVLVNTNNATSEDVISARNQIIKIVEQKFGITLEQEPEIL